MAIHLVPANGRDYSSQKQVLTAFREGQDFVLTEPSSRWNGQPLNRTHIEGLFEDRVLIKYNSLTRLVTLKKEDGSDWEIE